MAFDDLDEAVRLARDTDYGLSDEANAPFGGIGSSGTGSRAGGAEANVEAFTETQWLTVRPTIAPYPF